MASREAPSRLTTEQADAVEARNDQQSPLLRLPGELRNQIFQHACSGLVVSTTYHFDSLTRTRHLFLGAREAGSDNDYCYLYRLCSVMFVCRKMYAETHMLPFQMCTFYFPCDLENPQAWAELLGNDHFQAICHIRVGYTWLKYHLVRRHFYLQRYLSALPKLKRVVVCHCSSKIGASKADIISSIHKGCSRSDVEVVFELTKTTLKLASL